MNPFFLLLVGVAFVGISANADQEEEPQKSVAEIRAACLSIIQLKYFEIEVLKDTKAVDEILSGPDPFFACRAKWEKTLARIKNCKTPSEFATESKESIVEFEEFVEQQINLSPPKEWLFFLANGKLPSSIESGQTSGLREEVAISLDGKRYVIDVDTFTDEGGIKHVDTNGKVVWSTDFFSMNPYDTNFTGHFPSADWIHLEHVKYGSSLWLWCIGPGDIAYVIKFDAETGRRVNFLYLTPVEQRNKNP